MEGGDEADEEDGSSLENSSPEMRKMQKCFNSVDFQLDEVAENPIFSSASFAQ